MNTPNLRAFLVLVVVTAFFASVVPGYCQTKTTDDQITTIPPSKVVEPKLSEILKKRVPKGVPVLEDITVITPDQSVSPELAGFSGAWVGEWRGERTNAHMADQLLVFEKVTPKSVTVVSGGIGRFISNGPGGNYGQTWARRTDLQTKGEGAPIEVTYNGAEITYKIDGGTLKARSVTPGGTWIGTFTKVQ